MNGGVIVEASSIQTPALKQELLTEHYSVSAKRPSHKDKRQLKINTARTKPPHDGPHTHPGPPPNYPPYPPPSGPRGPSGLGYYGGPLPPPPPGFYPGPPPPGMGAPLSAEPVPGPSRRYSQPFVHGPPPPAPSHGMPQFPPQWGNVSPSLTSSHKRKRSDESRGEDERPRDLRMHTPPPTAKKRGVYVTSTQEEGRRLELVRKGTDGKEATPTRGPPRTKATTTLSVTESGKASLGSTDVLQTELDFLEHPHLITPKTPKTVGPAPDANDTPGTKANKTSRRLSAFKMSSRPSEPMYSIRLDMGQGQPCRVALRKDLALAFVGLDKATQVVEESRKEDDDGWAVVNGAPGSRPLIRPNWPDEEAPWKIGSGNRRARQMREDKERVTLLKRYLEASSDDDEEDDGAGRFPSHRGRASHTPHRPPGTGSATSDAKAALLSAMNRSSHRVATRRSAPPVFVPGGVVACVCKNNGSGGSLIPCSSCRTWFHLACVGNEAVQLGENWVCDPCIVQARRATLSSPTGRTPIAQRFTHERSHSGFRGDHALALAPSPMFAQDSGIPVTPMSMGPRTPPGRRRSARVLSYGADFWGPESPTTPAPAPRFFSNSTPRLEDPAFDVNSTPSRHLNTDPRMAGEFHSLFAVTPLMGRSRNASGMPGETPLPFPGNPMYAHSSGRRHVSGSSETGVVGRHEFLQSLTADRRASGERRPLVEPPSPSPYGGIGLGGPRHGSSNSMSHLRDDSAAASQRGLGLGMPMVHPRDE